VIEVDTVRGNNWAMRRTVFEVVGGFNPHWGPRDPYEELDLQLRIGRAGFKIVFAPSMSVFHHRAPPERLLQSRGPLQLRARNSKALMHAYARSYGIGPRSVVWRYLLRGDTSWRIFLNHPSGKTAASIVAGYAGKIGGLLRWAWHALTNRNC
jgi:GT2 family glycosyltransferase